jgi:hypothetical protein
MKYIDLQILFFSSIANMKVSTAFLIIILSILAPYGVKSEADFCLIDKTYFQIITVVSSSDSSTCHLDEDESWLLSEEEENLKSSNFGNFEGSP